MLWLAFSSAFWLDEVVISVQNSKRDPSPRIPSMALCIAFLNHHLDPHDSSINFSLPLFFLQNAMLLRLRHMLYILQWQNNQKFFY